MELTSRLRLARERIVAAATDDTHRRRWERRLATVSEAGAHHLERALELMTALEADLARLEDAQH